MTPRVGITFRNHRFQFFLEKVIQPGVCPHTPGRINKTDL